MPFPIIAAATAGLLLIAQMALGFLVSGSRNSADVWIGDGARADLARAIRRHGNLAENAGIFVAGFTLLELSGRWPTTLIVLCALFLVARLLHAIGLSMTNTRNVPRLLGGLGTSLTGLALGISLLWISGSLAFQ